MKKLDKLKLNSKKDWSPMELKALGKATDLIKGGTGKISSSGGDPGEGKKQKSG